MVLNKVYDFKGGTLTPLNLDVVYISFDHDVRIDEQVIGNAYKKKLEYVGGTNHASIIDFNNKLSSFTDEALKKVLTNIDPYDKNFSTVLCVSSFFARLELMLYMRTHNVSDNIVLARNLEEANSIIKRQKETLKKRLSLVG